MADLPGIIEGASEGLGLGHEFLKHIERTRMLCFVIDLVPSTFAKSRNPVADFDVLLNELAAFDEKLLTKPIVILGNKIDVGDVAVRSWKEFAKEIDPNGEKILIPISAKDKTNIQTVKEVLGKLLLDGPNKGNAGR